MSSQTKIKNPVWPDLWRHPETGAGELFFRNMSTREYQEFPFEKKRIGLTAYDGNGHRQASDDWFPVFVSISELQQRDLTISELRISFPDLPARLAA